jgi:aryl sulfotransferase
MDLIYPPLRIDSRRWHSIQVRPKDIIVATYMKSGTTWMQNIVMNLVCPEALTSSPLWKLSPCVERNDKPVQELVSSLETQKHSRVFKTHLPRDFMPWYGDAQYIIVGRDLRDVAISAWNFFKAMPLEKQERDSFPHPPETLGEFWQTWMTQGALAGEIDGYPFGSPSRFLQSWWDIKHRPNILFVHYNALLTQPEMEILKIADFLGIPVEDAHLSQVLQKTSFREMKKNADFMFNPEKLKGSADPFFHKGTSGQWKDVLTDRQIHLYENTVRKNVSEDCLHWLETGGR